MMRRRCPSLVPKKNVAHVVPAVMPAQASVQVVTVAVHPVHHAVPVARTQHLLTAAISPPKQGVINPPLSAYVKSPRQLQQLTVLKESKHAATRSQKVP
jgi:hypothetical protein